MPKTNFNTHNTRTAVGISVLCATVAATSILNLFSSKEASAIELPPYLNAVQQLDSGVCRSNGDSTTLYQNIRRVLAATDEERLNNDLVKIAIAIDSLERAPLRDDFVDERINGMKEYISDTSAWDDMTFIDMVKAAQNSPEYLAISANEASNDNVLIYIDHFAAETVAGYAENLKSALLNKAPELEDKPIWKVQAGSVENGTGGSWTLHELYYDAIDYYISNAKQLPEYRDFYSSHYNDLLTLQAKGQNEGSFLNICKISNSKYDVDAQINEVIAAAQRINPSFTVNLINDALAPDTSDEPSTGGDDNLIAPDTSNDETTIMSSDRNIKISGVNININYTLNANLVDDQVEFSGNDFANAINQAFFDINVLDNFNNPIRDTGKVSVSIKLPESMNPKNDFAIYYVPTTTSGEYLTDQAKAITDVKVSADGWLTFTTDHFSVYGIVEYAKGKAPNTGVIARNENSAAANGVKLAASFVAGSAIMGAATVACRQVLRRRDNGRRE